MNERTKAIVDLIEADIERLRRDDLRPALWWEFRRKAWIDGVRTSRAVAEERMRRLVSAVIDMDNEKENPMTDPVAAGVERVELRRIANKMGGGIDYLRAVCRIRQLEGVGHESLATKVADLVSARDRLNALDDQLPEGRLEAFAREHPLYEDDLDGPYCGYGAKDGTRVCPVRDWPLHWDAWEMVGTRFKRPSKAVRP